MKYTVRWAPRAEEELTRLVGLLGPSFDNGSGVCRRRTAERIARVDRRITNGESADCLPPAIGCHFQIASGGTRGFGAKCAAVGQATMKCQGDCTAAPPLAAIAIASRPARTGRQRS